VCVLWQLPLSLLLLLLLWLLLLLLVALLGRHLISLLLPLPSLLLLLFT
jgi:hypothetical protein